jgi:hypothetical protein
MKSIFLYIILLFPLFSTGQTMDELLEQESGTPENYEIAVFKATRVINGHSVEQMKPGHLDFRISHRFGELNQGAYELFGLDQATIHLSLEYGLTDWLMAGAGRSSLYKTFDGFVKIKLLRQTAGTNEVPVFLNYVGSAELNSSRWANPNRDNLFSSRITYVHQLLIARKINSAFSLQLSPVLVHKNLVPGKNDANDLFALGTSGRYKISNRVSINTEYFYAFRSENFTDNYPNALSVGVDIETGGHVFQLMLTNSLAMREGGFIWGTDNGKWANGGIHPGFNISRVFSLGKQSLY